MTDGQVDYHQIERNELLRSVDKNWIDHIDAMDQLRKGIGLRGYAQQDPVIAYKQEGYEMFEEMIDRVQTTTISRLLKGRIVRVQNGQPVPVSAPARPARPAADPNTGLSPMNPAIAKRAQEVMQERIKAREAAEKENGADGGNGNGGNGGLTPAANTTPPQIRRARNRRRTPAPQGLNGEYRRQTATQSRFQEL